MRRIGPCVVLAFALRPSLKHTGFRWARAFAVHRFFVMADATMPDNSVGIKPGTTVVFRDRTRINHPDTYRSRRRPGHDDNRVMTTTNRNRGLMTGQEPCNLPSRGSYQCLLSKNKPRTTYRGETRQVIPFLLGSRQVQTTMQTHREGRGWHNLMSPWTNGYADCPRNKNISNRLTDGTNNNALLTASGARWAPMTTGRAYRESRGMLRRITGFQRTVRRDFNVLQVLKIYDL